MNKRIASPVEKIAYEIFGLLNGSDGINQYNMRSKKQSTWPGCLISINGQHPINRDAILDYMPFQTVTKHEHQAKRKKECWLPLSSAAFILLSPLKNQSKHPIIVDMEKLLIYVGQMELQYVNGRDNVLWFHAKEKGNFLYLSEGIEALDFSFIFNMCSVQLKFKINTLKYVLNAYLVNIIDANIATDHYHATAPIFHYDIDETDRKFFLKNFSSDERQQFLTLPNEMVYGLNCIYFLIDLALKKEFGPFDIYLGESQLLLKMDNGKIIKQERIAYFVVRGNASGWYGINIVETLDKTSVQLTQFRKISDDKKTEVYREECHQSISFDLVEMKIVITNEDKKHIFLELPNRKHQPRSSSSRKKKKRTKRVVAQEIDKSDNIVGLNKIFHAMNVQKHKNQDAREAELLRLFG